jgi:hypothetical protein
MRGPQSACKSDLSLKPAFKSATLSEWNQMTQKHQAGARASSQIGFLHSLVKFFRPHLFMREKCAADLACIVVYL